MVQKTMEIQSQTRINNLYKLVVVNLVLLQANSGRAEVGAVKKKKKGNVEDTWQ